MEWTLGRRIARAGMTNKQSEEKIIETGYKDAVGARWKLNITEEWPTKLVII